MYWILATIAVLLAVAVPRLRPVGVVGCVVLGVLLGWGMIQRWSQNGGDVPAQATRSRPSAPTAQRALPLGQVHIENFRLSGTGAPFELRAHVRNESMDKQLRSITLRLTRRDCFEGALDPSGCVMIWQDEHWVQLSVPPSEARDFAVTLWAHSPVPRAHGEVRDEFELIGATAAQ